jgi:hypothetical protein
MGMIFSQAQTIQISTTLFVLAFVSFPLLHDLKPIIHERAPYGVAEVPNRLKFSFEAYFAGRYQKKAEELAKKQSGFWYPFTLLGNQLLLGGFNQITPFHNDSVFMGANGQLLQSIHIPAFNNLPDPRIESEKTRIRIEKLKRLQDHQNKRGKSVIALISPNVTALYPETVPDRYLAKNRDQRTPSYKDFKKKLDEAGVLYIDAVEVLTTQVQAKYPFRLYGQTASHWNDVAACEVLKRINEKFSEQKTKAFPEFNCDAWQYEYPPRSSDVDLLRVANLLTPSNYFEKMPYVQVDERTKNRGTKEFSRVTMAGSSYLFAFNELMSRLRLTKGHVHLFYFKSRLRKGETQPQKLNRQDLDWRTILDREIIIVDAPMRDPAILGYGFIEAAVRNIPRE